VGPSHQQLCTSGNQISSSPNFTLLVRYSFSSPELNLECHFQTKQVCSTNIVRSQSNLCFSLVNTRELHFIILRRQNKGVKELHYNSHQSNLRDLRNTMRPSLTAFVCDRPVFLDCKEYLLRHEDHPHGRPTWCPTSELWLFSLLSQEHRPCHVLKLHPLGVEFGPYLGVYLQIYTCFIAHDVSRTDLSETWNHSVVL
jgi:hypothetical protein